MVKVLAVRAFVALGSNLGDRLGHLRAAVAGLPGVVAVSDVYESDPVGGPAGQPAYLNAVVELDTGLSPRSLLEVGQALEVVAGRVRAERWGPRTLDVDVLVVGDLVVDEPDLVVPHPRMRERAFVLIPLHDLAPDLVGARPADPGVRLLGGLVANGEPGSHLATGADSPCGHTGETRRTPPPSGDTMAVFDDVDPRIRGAGIAEDRTGRL